MPTINELIAKHEEALAKAQNYNTEHPTMDAEQTATYNKLADEAGKALEALQRAKNLEDQKTQAMNIKSWADLPSDPDGKLNESFNIDEAEFSYGSDPIYQKAYNIYLRTGDASGIKQYLSSTNGQTVDPDADGGYLVDEIMGKEIIAQVTDATPFRAKARIFRINTYKGISWPELKTRVTASRGGEITEQPKSKMTFGKRKLTPHDYKVTVVTSESLVRSTAFPIRSFISEQIGDAHAEITEQDFMTGTGNGMALGLFYASDLGIGTDRDVNSGSNTAIANLDCFKNMIFGVKEQYRRKGEFLMHRLTYGETAKLKDNNGNYLLQTNNQGNQFVNLLGYNVTLSEFAPSTIAQDNYVAIFGDMSNYWIAESLAPAVRYLDQLYAETDEVGFKSNSQVDGAPMRSEAFRRLKISA